MCQMIALEADETFWQKFSVESCGNFQEWKKMVQINEQINKQMNKEIE